MRDWQGPRVWWRREFRFRVLWLSIVGVAVLACVALPLRATSGLALGFTLGSAGIAITISNRIMVALSARRRKRLADRARSANYRLCLECGYNLSGLPERWKCPECGTAYDIGGVRGLWREWSTGVSECPDLNGKRQASGK